jgi:2-amino-4-hydroxy-6-hydroxymethyldihydropteridine diphosphokinase
VSSFVGLGSNLGDREQQLRTALAALGSARLGVARVSSIYESAPVGPVREQPAFLNLVVELSGEPAPRALLAELQRLEAALGRVRARQQGPRAIDLDLLLVGERVAAWPELVLPHPEIGRRAFVLLPLLELEPGLRDPRTGRPFAERLEAVRDQPVRKIGSTA